MNRLNVLTMVFFCALVALQSCNTSQETTPENQPALITQTEEDTASQQKITQDTTVQFVSEPGLFKMIDENYQNEMTTERSILVIPVVSGCSCSIVGFEELDSHVNTFKSQESITTYWLLKGEDQAYSEKIAKYHPEDIELIEPKRSFQEYGLFQSSNLLFELRNNSEIVRWTSVAP